MSAFSSILLDSKVVNKIKEFKLQKRTYILMFTINLTLMIRTKVFHEILSMQFLSYISEQQYADRAHYLVNKDTMR